MARNNEAKPDSPTRVYSDPAEFLSPAGREALLRIREKLRLDEEREFAILYPGEPLPNDQWELRRMIDKKFYTPEDYQDIWGEYDRRNEQELREIKEEQ